MNYDLILYIGLFLIVGGFCLFIYNEMRLRKIDMEQARQASLDIAFRIAKQTEERNNK